MRYPEIPRSYPLKVVVQVGLVLLALIVLSLVGCVSVQRGALFHPTHRADMNGLDEWNVNQSYVGCAREVADPQTVWLVLHGNGGQASDRVYALSRFSNGDSVYILEYPGYGFRPGKPTPDGINAAARAAFRNLRERFPDKPLGVVGESLGTGPACLLTNEPNPPEQLILVNPYESIAAVADAHASLLPSRLVFRGTWDNRRALAGYRGRVAIFSAEGDMLIPPTQGRALAEMLPNATFTLIPGGHNDWPRQTVVKIRHP